MILNHKYKFLFIKVPKTAGVSMEMVLSQLPGTDKDIVSPLGAGGELERFKNGVVARNFNASLSVFYKLLLMVRYFKDVMDSVFETDVEKRLRNNLSLIRYMPKKYYDHISINEVYSLLTEEVINEYYKVGFIRHPVSRAISYWMWVNRGKDISGLSLEEARSDLKALIASDSFKSCKYYLYSDDRAGLLKKTLIYKFEQLNEGLDAFYKVVGVDQSDVIDLPGYGTKPGKEDRLSFAKSDLPDEELRRILMTKCAWEYESYYQPDEV